MSTADRWASESFDARTLSYYIPFFHADGAQYTRSEVLAMLEDDPEIQEELKQAFEEREE